MSTVFDLDFLKSRFDLFAYFFLYFYKSKLNQVDNFELDFLKSKFDLVVDSSVAAAHIGTMGHYVFTVLDLDFKKSRFAHVADLRFISSCQL